MLTIAGGIILAVLVLRFWGILIIGVGALAAIVAVIALAAWLWSLLNLPATSASDWVYIACMVALMIGIPYYKSRINSSKS